MMKKRNVRTLRGNPKLNRVSTGAAAAPKLAIYRAQQSHPRRCPEFVSASAFAGEVKEA